MKLVCMCVCLLSLGVTAGNAPEEQPRKLSDLDKEIKNSMTAEDYSEFRSKYQAKFRETANLQILRQMLEEKIEQIRKQSNEKPQFITHWKESLLQLANKTNMTEWHQLKKNITQAFHNQDLHSLWKVLESKSNMTEWHQLKKNITDILSDKEKFSNIMKKISYLLKGGVELFSDSYKILKANSENKNVFYYMYQKLKEANVTNSLIGKIRETDLNSLPSALSSSEVHNVMNRTGLDKKSMAHLTKTVESGIGKLNSYLSFFGGTESILELLDDILNVTARNLGVISQSDVVETIMIRLLNVTDTLIDENLLYDFVNQINTTSLMRLALESKTVFNELRAKFSPEVLKQFSPSSFDMNMISSTVTNLTAIFYAAKNEVQKTPCYPRIRSITVENLAAPLAEMQNLIKFALKKTLNDPSFFLIKAFLPLMGINLETMMTSVTSTAAPTSYQPAHQPQYTPAYYQPAHQPQYTPAYSRQPSNIYGPSHYQPAHQPQYTPAY